MQFAYEIVEFGTGKILGGGISNDGVFASAEDFLLAERVDLETKVRPGIAFTLREISVEQYNATLVPPGHLH